MQLACLGLLLMLGGCTNAPEPEPLDLLTHEAELRGRPELSAPPIRRPRDLRGDIALDGVLTDGDTGQTDAWDSTPTFEPTAPAQPSSGSSHAGGSNAIVDLDEMLSRGDISTPVTEYTPPAVYEPIEVPASEPIEVYQSPQTPTIQTPATYQDPTVTDITGLLEEVDAPDIQVQPVSPDDPRFDAPAIEPPARRRLGIDELDDAYVIGPTAARDMGYRIDWQVNARPADGSGVRIMTVQDDSIFILDGLNFLTRLRASSGEQIWRLPIAQPVQDIQGINYIPDTNMIYLAMGGSLLVLDAATGNPVQRPKLQKIVSTSPVRYGPYLIYGSRNGQAVWYSHTLGFQWRASQVARAMLQPPSLHGDKLIAIGSDGRIVAFDANRARSLWDNKLLDGVESPPDFGMGQVFIACSDQYLYSLDMSTGRTRWRRLTTAPLVDSPVFHGTRVYQNVPGEGVTCFEADPLDAFDGNVIWVSDGTFGNMITSRQRNLLIWDEAIKRMTIVNAGQGAVIKTIGLPNLEYLHTTSRSNGEIYAMANDGRLVHLVPRN